MKKLIAIALTAVLMLAMLSGCNRQVFDTTYKYDRAIIHLPNGEIVDGKVQSWRDYENSDQIQVKIDGVTYLVHSTNVVLIAD
jgi:ribosomal protein S1